MLNQEEMPKNAIIQIRIDPEAKEALESCAKRRGLTLTSFITQTMQAEVERNPIPRGRAVRGSVPPFFRTACEEARRGGAGGYTLPGRILWIHALRTLEEDPLAELAQIMFDADDHKSPFDLAPILSWCERHVPKCLAIVPRTSSLAFGP